LADRIPIPEESPSDRFWAFSLALYGKSGVAPALLDLQDRLGLDVNILLFCCWAGKEGRALSPADIAAVEAVTQPWQAEIVRPLRALRRRLKSGFRELPAEPVAAFRKRIADLEIEGERIAQAAMAPLLPPGAPDQRGASLVSVNLRAYFGHAQLPIGPSETAALTTILRACCPEADPTVFGSGA
jgi:uncharacterized protein (TIGR02444 family)